MLPFIIAVGGCTTADLVNEPQKSTKTVEPAVSTNVLYLTDRAPAETKAHTQTYGATRSRFISFGNVTLRAPPSTSKKAPDLQVTSVVETGRFPKAPYEIELTPKGARRSPAAVNAYETAKHAFQSEIAARLARSPRKEVVVFIHGYNNTFEDALKATGNICDTLKNEFVCIALTWPAGGSGGLAMGYNIDRESGEFAAADIRRAIRVISETPGLQRLHLMAHSRGTDVLASSLQQLGIEAYATKSSLGERYKIGNLIFFAPDIDLDVAETKMFGIVSDPDAAFGGGANPLGYFPPQGSFHLTIYSSPNDKALGASTFLFGSAIRLGQLASKANSPDAKDVQSPWKTVEAARVADFIEYVGDSGFIGHGYFQSDPAVRADLLALVRDHIKAGEPGRPLVEVKRPYWRIGTPKK